MEGQDKIVVAVNNRQENFGYSRFFAEEFLGLRRFCRVCRPHREISSNVGNKNEVGRGRQADGVSRERKKKKKNSRSAARC